MTDPDSTATAPAISFFIIPTRPIFAALPAMGYSKAQLDDLAATIENTPCDTIVIGTPVDLARLLPLSKPHCRVFYDLEEIGRPVLSALISGFVEQHLGKFSARQK